jgi:hypothetical protein
MKRAHLLLILCLASALPVLAIDGEELMRRHLAAVAGDGEKVNQLSNLRMTGLVDKYGLRGDVGVFADLPDRFAMKHQYAAFMEDFVLRGKSGECLELTGRPRPLEQGELADLKTLNYVLTYQYLRPGQMLPTLVRQEGDVYTAAVSSPDGISITLRVDAQTFLLKGFSFMDNGGRDRQYSIEEYKDVEGLRLPVRLKDQDVNPALYTFNQWEFNKGVEGSLFSIPSMPQSIGLPDKGAVRLPLQIYFRLPLIKAWIGNSPALTFLVDLGLPFSVIDRSIATQLGLGPAGRFIRPTRYLGSEFAVARIPSLLLREVDFKDRVFLVTNMMPPSANVQLPIHGVIGNDLFSQAVVQLDMAGEQLRLFAPRAFSAGGGRKVSLQPQGGMLMVPANLDGVDTWLELTSSYGDSVLFGAGSPAAQALAQKNPAGADGFTLGLQYGVPERILRVGTMTVESTGAQGVLIHLAQFPADSVLNRRQAGWIGTGFLRRFTVSVDFPGNTLYLEPGPALGEPDLCNATGLYVVKSGGRVVVQQVVKGSPAEKAGLQVGDTLTAINDYPAEQVVFDRLYGFLYLAADGSVRLKAQREGTELEVTLKNESAF